MALFKHLDVFMRYVGREMDAEYLINELVKNNTLICSQVPEQQLQKIVNSIAEGCKYPHFIELLENLCIVNKRPIRRNQNLVLKLMIEKQESTMVLFNDVEEIQRRNDLISIDDHIQNPQSLLLYHMKLIDLIRCGVLVIRTVRWQWVTHRV